MTETATASPAMDAAQQLADQGEHVHLVADAESRCLTGHCPPTSLLH